MDFRGWAIKACDPSRCDISERDITDATSELGNFSVGLRFACRMAVVSISFNPPTRPRSFLQGESSCSAKPQSRLL